MKKRLHIHQTTFITKADGTRVDMSPRVKTSLCGLRLKPRHMKVRTDAYCFVCVEKLIAQVEAAGGIRAFVPSPITEDDFVTPPAAVEPKVLDVTHQARVGSV